ncbi:hypothetical protein LguiA_013298 [Lonicera macranthoides]
MALRIRRVREISRLLPQICQGNGHKLLRRDIHLLVSHLISLHYICPNINRGFGEGGCHAKRFSTISQTLHESLPKVDLLSFIESTLDEQEGPCHSWLNKFEDSKDFHGRDGVFLVLAGAFLNDILVSGRDSVILFEKVKSLQQRYPSLHVMGFQSTRSISSEAALAHLLQITMREYITFPILLTNKNFSEVVDGTCYIIFKGFSGPPILYEKGVDIGIIDRAIKELNMQHNEKPSLPNSLKATWVKPIEVTKEPYLCSSLRNSLLYFPGCIAVDEDNGRLFLSDINHHRIIMFDGNGKILDCIGSSPGFEDGEFESAKLMRPAASFYHASGDSLYFVDSENHAIRRADMKRKVVETLYPTNNTNKHSISLWNWIMDKLWTKRDVDPKYEEFDSESFLFPWHLMKSLDNDLFIFNRSFEMLWIMDFTSGVIKEVVKGFPKILEICGHMIMEKSSLLKQMPSHWLQQHVDSNCSLEEFPYAGLMSSAATFQDHIVICDSVGQAVLKLNKRSGTISSFQFSNFGILGLPYWLSLSLERVYAVGDVLPRVQIDHTERFSLLPGRVDIKLNIDLPEDTELREPIQEGCIWCQARGTATDVLTADIRGASSEKVGVAQQWYNELDTLASLTPEIKLDTEEESTTSDVKVQEGKLCIDCAVNTSPGTSEVIIYAALYLKLKRYPSSSEKNREKKVARIVDVLNPTRSGSGRKDLSMQLLLTSNTDLDELILMRPLHVRIKIDCRDHPKADNSKDIILTDSSIDVNVALK